MEAAPTPETEPPYAEPQRRVQRWLGRCMLMLQQYEKLLKALLHDMQVEAWHTGHDEDGRTQFEQRRAFGQDALRTMTLGTLVKHFTGQFLMANEEREETQPPDDSVLRMQFRWSFQLQPADHDRMLTGLRELVDLRNLLVHHFVDQFDLQTVPGCEVAQQALERHYARVLLHWEELRGIGRHLSEASDHLVRLMKSPDFAEVLTTGKLPLANAHVVQALRDTLAKLSRSNEFVALRDVLAELQRSHPDETPERYGRSSWRQLVHEAGIFELRRTDHHARSLRLRGALSAELPEGDAALSAPPAPAWRPAP